jgi:nucleoside-diphosphate-sugar epimerase
MKKVLVTGSLGYLGSVLTGYLGQNGFDCIGLDTGFFRDCLLYEPPNTKTIIRDVRDVKGKDLAGINAVVHLAAISNDPFGNINAKQIYDPVREYSKKIAQLCKKKNIQFVFASSCSVYGIGQSELVDEKSPTIPQTQYSVNKLQIEQDLQELSDDNFSPIALRFATAFGLSPRIRFDLVTNMLTGMAFTTGKIILNSNGMSWRPNVHVLDICQAIKCAIDSDYNDGNLLILNVGDEKNNLQVIDIAQTVQRVLPGHEVEFLNQNPELDKEGLVKDKNVKDNVDTRSYRVDFTKIREMFKKFKCHWSMEEGIKDMVERFRDINLTPDQFKNKNYYRLQQIEYLYKHQLLSPDLRWIKGMGQKN